MRKESIKVLLVGDSSENRTLIRSTLAADKRANYDLREAATLREAKDRLETGRFDVVLMDLRSPEGRGLDAFKELEAEKNTTPVVVLTAGDDRELAMEALAAGAQDYVVKEDLASAVLPRALCSAVHRRQVEHTVAAEQLGRQTAVLTAVNKVLHTALSDAPEEQITRTCVAAAEALTESELGFLCEFDEEGRIDSVTFRDASWTGSTFSKGEALAKLQRMGLRGIFGKIVREGRSVTCNEPRSDPDWVEPPPGHPTIHRFLGVPLKRGETTIGLVGLANKRRPYESTDRQAVEALSVAFAEALNRKRTEEALERSKREWEVTFDALKDWVCVLDESHRIRRSNRAGEALLGVPITQLVGRNCCELVHGSPTPMPDCPVKSALNGGKSQSVEYALPDRDRWVSASAGPVHDAVGAISGVVHVVRDITERKQAEEVIHRSYETQKVISDLLQLSLQGLPLQELLERALELVLAISWPGLQPRGAVFLAAEDQEVLVMKASRGMAPQLLESCARVPFGLCHCGRAAATGEVQFVDRVDERHEVTYEGISPHGHYCLPICSGDTVLGVLNIYVEAGHRQSSWEIEFLRAIVDALAGVLKRTQAEEALRQQLTQTNLLNQVTRAAVERQDVASMYRVLLHHLEKLLPVALDAMLVYDRDRDVFLVSALGPQSAKLAAGSDLEEGGELTPGSNCLEEREKGQPIYHPDLAAVSTPPASALLRLGMRSCVGSPLQVGGQLLGILLTSRREVNGFRADEIDFLRQVSEHVALAAHQAQLYHDLRRAYDELRDTQAVAMQQERLSALGQMASGVAHDINNALSPVVGYSQLLLSRPNLDADERRYLEAIRTAGEDITRIVARMREFYRKRDETEPWVPVDLNRLIDQVIELTRPRWKDMPQEQGRRVEVRTELTEGLPPVRGNESELREALTNLLLNAVDAMPQGGVITIRTRLEGPNEQWRLPEKRHVTVDVADTGVGMDEETRKRCLEPFYSTKGEAGTGLGLAMVFGVMERHEGDIAIKSQVGKGTTIRLFIPVTDGQPAVRSAAASPAKDAAPRRVLCIDDEPTVRELVTDMLATFGHTVRTADGGAAGLQAFREAAARGEPYEVVVTDLGMPDVDGRVVARSVKEESPATRVILLTGWGQRMGAEGNLPTEVDVVLSKPPSLEELRQAIVGAPE